MQQEHVTGGQIPTAREGLLLDKRDTKMTGTLLGQMVTSSVGEGAGGEEQVVGCEGDGRMEELTAGIGAS